MLYVDVLQAGEQLPGGFHIGNWVPVSQGSASVYLTERPGYTSVVTNPTLANIGGTQLGNTLAVYGGTFDYIHDLVAGDELLVGRVIGEPVPALSVSLPADSLIQWFIADIYP